MKKSILILTTILLLLLLGGSFSVCAAESDFSERLIIEENPDIFPVVRHIVMRGSQEEIGYKLAELAQERYKINLSRNPSEYYGKARFDYLKNNYPQLFQRAQGVLKAYGLNPQNTTVDSTSLIYSVSDFACSAMYFPGALTQSGNSTAIRNMDFSTGSVNQLVGLPRQPNDLDMFKEIYIMEIYPHQGNGVLYISTIDMLSGTWDGINEHGLSIFGLVDLSRHNTPIPFSGSRAIGLTPPQTMKMILENCKTIEEAKIKLLTSKTFDLIEGIHYLVADAHGNSFIFEVNKNDDQAYITEGGENPQIMTNTPVWDMPSKENIPKVFENPYDSLRRYMLLTEAVKNYENKYSESFIIQAMESVFPKYKNLQTGISSMGLRPLWQVIYDTENISMKVRFWLKDGKEMENNEVELIMSQWYEFKLKR